MAEEFDHLSEEEKLQAENEFLKMKMMLEQGAKFGNMQDGNMLPPDIENQFLKNVMAFEKKFEGERKVIKLFDKIGRPQQFKPVGEIPDNEIESAWEQLDLYLRNHDIALDAFSPKVTYKELYRFTTEELFEYEMDDHNLPGWTSQFTYDEFYPDDEFDNTNAAVNDCISQLLSAEPLKWMMHFRSENITLNQHNQLDEEDFKRLVNLFKTAYDNITDVEINGSGCSFDDDVCTVSGTYSFTAVHQNNNNKLSGNWTVQFEKDTDLGYWYIFSVQVEEINF